MTFTWKVDLQQLQATLEGLTDGLILMDPDGRVLYLNEAARQLYGVRSPTETETQSVHLRDYEVSTFDLRQPSGELVSVDERPTVRALQGETFENLTYQVCPLDTTQTKWFSFSSSQIHGDADGRTFGLLTIRDVTEQRQVEGRELEAHTAQAKAEAEQVEAEQAQRNAEAGEARAATTRQAAETRFETLLETNPAPTLICRLVDGRAVAVNDGFLAMTGYGRDEVMGADIPELGLLESETSLADTLGTIGRGESVALAEVTLRHKHGQAIAAVGSAKAIDISGDACGVLTFIDVSEKERLARQLREAHRRLAQVRERERLSLARELHDDVIQELIGLSYELANTGKEADRQELSREALTPLFTHYRGSVLALVRQVRRLISGLRPAGLEDFGLQVALEDYVTQLLSEREAPEPRVSFDFETGHEALPRQITLCLFRTAQEALRNVRAHARASQICIRFHLDGEEAVLSIQDDGRGFRVPDSYGALEREQHFGLAGSEEYVTSLGGSLQVTSELGQGTTVTVRLPLSSPVVA